MGCRGCGGKDARPDAASRLDAAQVAPPPQADGGGDDGGDPDVVEEIPLPGFDPKGEPYIKRMRDGSLVLVIQLVPPSWAEEHEEGRWDNFEREIRQAIGTRVDREDREFFIIPKPKPDTVDRLRAFLGAFHRR